MSRTPRSHSAATAPLGRRERQIVDAVYRLGRATVAAVRAELEDPPSYSAVRAMLNLLEEKNLLQHEADGLRYVYLPVGSPAQARTQAIAHVVRTFFGGSTADAATALFDLPDHKWSKAELARLQALVNDAMKEGR